MDDGAHRAFVGHAAFDAFGHQFFDAGGGVLEVAVGRAGFAGHGAQGAHAPVGFVVAALEQFHFAGGFFGAGQQRADHNGVGAGGDGLGDVAGEADATVGDQRHVGALEGGGHFGDGGDLRDADAGDDAGGADGARADAHFDAVGAGFHQRDGGFGGGDVAADHVHVREVLLDPGDAVEHALRVTVGGVHHDHIHARFHQRGDALFGAAAGAHGRADAQTALAVFTGVGVAGGFFDVLDGDHAAQLAGVVDHQDLFDAVLVQQGLHFVGAGALFHRYQAVAAGHDVGHGLVVVGDEAGVTAGDDAHHLLAFHHRHAGDVVGVGEVDQLAHGGVGADGDRVLDHAGLVFLDGAHLAGLIVHRHAFVQDANAAFLGHGDRQTVFGDGVHGGGQQRDVQLDVARQARLQRHLVGQHIGVGGQEQNVVERQCFLGDSEHVAPLGTQRN